MTWWAIILLLFESKVHKNPSRHAWWEYIFSQQQSYDNSFFNYIGTLFIRCNDNISEPLRTYTSGSVQFWTIESTSVNNCCCFLFQAAWFLWKHYWENNVIVTWTFICDNADFGQGVFFVWIIIWYRVVEISREG